MGLHKSKTVDLLQHLMDGEQIMRLHSSGLRNENVQVVIMNNRLCNLLQRRSGVVACRFWLSAIP